jgi:hypothetical protein
MVFAINTPDKKTFQHFKKAALAFGKKEGGKY